MRMFLLATAAVALAVTIANNADAAVLVNEDFEGYGARANFTDFTQLNVTDGSVDVLQDAGVVATPYGTGFVDLDGSAGDGGYLRTDYFAFQQGDVVTLTFDYAGNHQGTFDSLLFGFKSTGLFTFKDVTIQNGATKNTSSAFIGSTFGTSVNNLSPAAPWTHVSFSFTAGGAGSLSAYVGTSSADTKGPLVDNFNLSVSPAGAVPEPATWALMIGGFGGAGAMLRRRRRTAIS